MKKLILVYTTTCLIISCTKEDNQILVESEHTGVESMIIKSKLDITIEALGGAAEDHPFIQGLSSNFYGAAYTGYVAPAYGDGNTSVTATFLSSTKEMDL